MVCPISIIINRRLLKGRRLNKVGFNFNVSIINKDLGQKDRVC